MTVKLETFNEILDFAIKQEIEAETFYRELAKRVEATSIREILEEFAEEEAMHQEKLQKVKGGECQMLDGGTPVPNIYIAEFLPEAKTGPNMDLEDALILAMKLEKAAYRFYIDLAVDAPTQELMDLFMALAHEEANHKLRFEIEYDDWILDR